MNRIAVIDVETTGFGRNDRLVEIAIVTLDSRTLTVLDEFESLINPLRDFGRTSEVHGISAAMVECAPTMEELFPAVVRRLNGAVLVAHNLSFDARMLSNECRRVHGEFDGGRGLCTYRTTGLRLQEAIEEYGLACEGAHRALSDARATASLAVKVFSEHSADLTSAQVTVPMVSIGERTMPRAAEKADGNMAIRCRRTMIRRRPIELLHEPKLAYFELLDVVLADAVMTRDERAELELLALELGLDKADCESAHQQYLCAVLRAALRDGNISECERDLLGKISSALGLACPDTRVAGGASKAPSLAVGRRVCFTGAAVDGAGLRIERADLEAIASARGLVNSTSAAKRSCDLLVAADLSSFSGKAQKAREAGIPIMSVLEFLREIDLLDSVR